MTQRKDLREVGSIGIAVQAYAFDPQRVQDGGEIVGCQGGTVQRGRTPQRAPTSADVGLRELRGVLQLPAVDGSGAPGAAVVHDQYVVAGAQRLEERQVLVPGFGRGIARAALGRNQRTGGRPRCRMRVVLEIDRNCSRHRATWVKRTHEFPAPGRRRVATMQMHLSDRNGSDSGGSGDCGSLRRGPENR